VRELADARLGQRAKGAADQGPEISGSPESPLVSQDHLGQAGWWRGGLIKAAEG
jgi:hypothetical protein